MQNNKNEFEKLGEAIENLKAEVRKEIFKLIKPLAISIFNFFNKITGGKNGRY